MSALEGFGRGGDPVGTPGDTGSPADPTPSGWPGAVLLLALAAVVLRLVLFLGRGNYVAFDEGFYLLLGRSLYTGQGFSLVGLPHVALSPLFPVFAGAVGKLIGSWVWGGRIVAAVASGLLVLPAWAVFRRLSDGRTPLIAAALVATLPSLAPFVAAYWVGADLWVGAGPVFQLFLFTGIAAWLRADERGGGWTWAAAGAAFGLAFLARPEAILTWGLLGLAALAIAARRRSLRRLAGAAAMGATLLVVCAPYWFYLHGVTGEWMLTGRGIAPAAAAERVVSPGEHAGGATTIERMLWADDPTYQRTLYGLDPTGLRLASSYWGVYPRPDSAAGRAPAADATDSAPPAAPPTSRLADSPATPADSPAPLRDSAAPDPGPAATAPPRPTPPAPPSTLALYFRALGIILPLLLWPFVVLGVAAPRPRSVLRRELPVSLALLGTSVAIAALVAVDPRTQLFLVPLLAFYAARGFSLLEREIQQRTEGKVLRPGFVETTLAAVAVAWLLSINGWRLYMSLAVGSPHHIVGAQNRRVAEALDSIGAVPPGPVMSWHPALAVFSDRDWRVLPYAPLPQILRYAHAAGASVIVLSAYYPPDLGVERLDTRYLILPVPTQAATRQGWHLRILAGDSIARLGTLEPTPDDGGE